MTAKAATDPEIAENMKIRKKSIRSRRGQTIYVHKHSNSQKAVLILEILVSVGLRRFWNWVQMPSEVLTWRSQSKCKIKPAELSLYA